MALTREEYKAFEDVVGQNNISDDPALLDSYTYPLMATSLHLGPYYRVWTPRSEATILPETTEEVQAIVKLCNKYGKKVKAASTFWGGMGYPTHDNVIQLDMRRMDKIIEIDVKNQFAIIEPYVIGATLQAEAMKVGLNTHMIGAGCGCSPLASATAYLGQGPDSAYMGYGDENMLGLEWVMPDGEIMRTGTLGSGLDWSHGEGPGPGVRGIVRGASGNRGGLGVFTKCAIKLFPWPGPAVMPVEGTVPAYKTEIPEKFRSYTLAFPTWEAFADGCHKIWDAEIGYIAHRQFNKFGRNLKMAMLKILTNPDMSLNDLEPLLQDPEVKKVTENMVRDFQIVLAGLTKKDIEWQDKALDDILKETGGWKVAELNEAEMEKWIFLYMVRLGHKNLNIVYAGSYDGSVGFAAPPDYAVPHIEGWGDLKAEWEKKDAMTHCGGDSMMGAIGGMGGGGNVSWENFVHFDPHDQYSVEGTYEFFDASSVYNKERGLPADRSRMNAPSRGEDGKARPTEEMVKMLSASPKNAQVFKYQGKIKAALDPNDVGDTHYLHIPVDHQ
jgi:hypothetical protein